MAAPAFGRDGERPTKYNFGYALATIWRSWAWLSASYKNYLYHLADESVDIATLRIYGIGADSGDSGRAISNRKRRV